MWLEIVSTTDNLFLGRAFDAAICPIVLSEDKTFTPDRVFSTGEKLWRLVSSSYVIHAREVTHA